MSFHGSIWTAQADLFNTRDEPGLHTDTQAPCVAGLTAYADTSCGDFPMSRQAG